MLQMATMRLRRNECSLREIGLPEYNLRTARRKLGMKRLVLIGFLALGTAFGSSAASATPAATGVAGLSKTQSGIELAQYHRRGHYNRGHYRRDHYRGHRRHYRGHDRYRGWHRYHSRPYNWRARGCAVVGPIWFCP
jgi:hypothetical protein